MGRIRATSTAALLAALIAACSDGNGPNTARGPSDSTPRRLIAGETVACALSSERDVYCWGVNTNFWDYGAAPAVIAGGFSPALSPVPALTSMAVGVSTHFCGLTGKVARCWARGTQGQLGGGTAGDVGNAATVVSGGIEWADISVSRLTTCGVSTTGDGYCWGHNQRGEIGSPARPIGVGTHEPSLIDGGHTFRTVVAGWLHACGITTTGQTLCWGANHSGQLGIGTVDTTAHRSPELVSGGHNFVAIALGSRYTCALTAEGEAYCWGENAGAQLGNGTREDRSEPTAVSTGVRFVRIVASSGFANGAFVAPPTSLQGGVGHTCGLTAAGKAYCWGWNGNGELGDGSFDDKLFPSPVAGNLVFETIAVGGAYTCGMQGDRVWCWGSNVAGQLGRGNSANSATPVAVRPPFGPG